MGRGSGDNHHAIAPSRQSEGEIALTDAESLDSVKDMVATNSEEVSYGTFEDTQAIRRIISKLQSSGSFTSVSEEILEDKAIDLYNKLCDLIRTNKASQAQLEQAASLFGETEEDLLTRLAS